MKDIVPTFSFDLDGLSRSAWTNKIEQITEDNGDAEPVGPDHRALFVDAGRTLIVTFETIAGIRKNQPNNAPIGWAFAQQRGWSSLTLLADAETDWFRHPAVFGYFDRLIDDGFFDDFDNVLFYGAGASGYAAAAFSVAAPDAHVLAIQPQATLDPARARWDRRFPEARRLDFSSRFGFAPMMVETAAQVWVVHDPSVIEDGMHASLFDADNITHFTTPYLGPHAEIGLQQMGVLHEMIEAAMDGTLNGRLFDQLWRARQSYLPYLRTLFFRLDAEGEHPQLLARLCRAVIEEGNRPMFAERLAELRADGVTLSDA
ncbi:MAG: hypothetical protein AAGL89_04625 [Pseudomonadota bacterium]